MRMFLLHVIRSIKKAPLQPIFIVLTLSLSVAAMLVSLRTAEKIVAGNAEEHSEKSYVSDITLRPSAESGLGLMPDSEIREALVGEGALVLGEFELTVLHGEGDGAKMHTLVAADLLSADRFYSFKYSSYGGFTEDSLDSSVILSYDTAEELGYSVGDTFAVELLGRSIKLTVGAIALSEGAMKDRLGYIDIGAVLEELARKNPAIAAFPESLIPYTSVRVRVFDPNEVDRIVSKLSSEEDLKSFSVINEKNNVGNIRAVNLIAIVITGISALIVTLLSAIVIATSLELLHKKRRKDTALFMLAGADSRALSSIRYLESMIYAAFGAALGLLMLIPFFGAVNALFGWREGIALGPYDVLLSLFLSPALMCAATFVNLRRTRGASVSELVSESDASSVGKPSGAVRVTVVSCLAVLSLSAAALLPARTAFYAAIPSMLFLALAVFELSPLFVKLGVSLILKCLSLLRAFPARLYLAARSIRSSHPLCHTGRMMTVTLTLVLTVFSCLGSTSAQVNALIELFDCDYIAYGVTRSTEARLASDAEVEAVYRFGIFDDAVSENGDVLVCYSLDPAAIGHINESYAPTAAPENGSAAIAAGVARLLEIGVGDTLSIYLDTEEYRFTVTEIIDSPTNAVCIDPEVLGKKNDLVCVKMKEGSDGFYRIRSELSASGAQLTSVKAVTTELTGLMGKYVRLVGYAAVLSLAIATVGMINLLISEHLGRTNELRAYYSAGLTRRGVWLIELTEALLLLAISVVIAIPMSMLLLKAIDLSASSFGVGIM